MIILRFDTSIRKKKLLSEISVSTQLNSLVIFFSTIFFFSVLQHFIKIEPKNNILLKKNITKNNSNFEMACP